MPYTVPSSFAKFLENISLTGDHKHVAEARRKRLIELLKDDFMVIESFPTGSIPKGTALKAHADLDIMVVLHYDKHVKGKNPSEVLQAVRNSLSGYKTGVRKNGQAVTLSYESWPSVDIVPVSRSTNEDGSVSHYNVPDMNTERWIMSKPKRHAANMKEKSASVGVSFLDLVRMVKQWNRVHSELMSSYHIEVLALMVCSSTISDLSWAVFNFFDEAIPLVESGLAYNGSFADDYLDPDGREEVLKRLRSARDKARTAWLLTYNTNSDHEAAVRIWQQIFGSKFPAYG